MSGILYMPKEKTKSQIFAGKLLQIAVNSLDLYYEEEAKILAQRRWTIAKTKLKTLSRFNIRKLKTTE